MPQSHASVSRIVAVLHRRSSTGCRLPRLRHCLLTLCPPALCARARVCVWRPPGRLSPPSPWSHQPTNCSLSHVYAVQQIPSHSKKISAWKVGSPLLLKPPPDRGERPGSRGRIGSLFDCSQQPACVSSTLPLPNHLCLAQQPAQEWWSHLGTERESRRLARAQGRRRHAPVAAAH